MERPTLSLSRLAASRRHLVAFIFAVVCPVLLHVTKVEGTVGYARDVGVAFLPAVYMAQWLEHDRFYRYFFCFPLFVLFMFALHKTFLTGSVLSSGWSENIGVDLLTAFLPSLTIYFHYAMVFLASRYYRKSRDKIASFCFAVEEFLDLICYRQHMLPKFLYIRHSRVISSLANLFKVIVSVVMIVVGACFGATVSEYTQAQTGELFSDASWCNAAQKLAKGDASMLLWINLAVLCLEETVFHCCIVLTGEFDHFKVGIRQSFTEHVVSPSYWEWYVIALFSPTPMVWVPIIIMWLRFIPISLGRILDWDESISSLLWFLDLVFGIFLLTVHFAGYCSVPHALIYRQLSVSVIWLCGLIQKWAQRKKLFAAATKPVGCKLYFPVNHKDIDVQLRKWMTSTALPEQAGPIDLPGCRCGNCSGEYYPEGELVFKRKEYRLEFDNPWTEGVWSGYTRETKIPGAWIVVKAGECAGIKMSPRPVGTALEGQFRIMHTLVDTRGCFSNFGEVFGRAGSSLLVAKRYKTHPEDGYALVDDVGSIQNVGERMIMHNRHQRLLTTYFQDVLVLEKADEYGRAFNAAIKDKVPARKVQVLRSAVMEVEWEEDRPSMFIVEKCLDDDAPFQKFNNNDYVPGKHARVTTPNLFSLYTYLSSGGKLILCDIQGKKTKFTDVHFHTSIDYNNVENFESSSFESDFAMTAAPDWLHGDGGLRMQKRVLVGLVQQKGLPRIIRKICRREMDDLASEMRKWLDEPEFAHEIKNIERNTKSFSDYFRALCPATMTNTTGPGHVCKEEKLIDKMGKSRHGGNVRSQTFGTTFDTVDLSHRSVELFRGRSEACCGLFDCFYIRDVAFSRAVSGSEHCSTGRRSRFSSRNPEPKSAWPPASDASGNGDSPNDFNRSRSDGLQGHSLSKWRSLSERQLSTRAGDHVLSPDVDKSGDKSQFGILTRVGSDDSLVSLDWHCGMRNSPAQGLRKTFSHSSIRGSLNRSGPRDSFHGALSPSDLQYPTPETPKYGTLTRIGSNDSLQSMDSPWHNTPAKIAAYEPGSFNMKRSILTRASPSRDSPRDDSVHSSSDAESPKPATLATPSRQGSFERLPGVSLSRTASDDSAISSSALLVRVNSAENSLSNSPSGVSPLRHPPPIVDRFPIVAPRPRLKSNHPPNAVIPE